MTIAEPMPQAVSADWDEELFQLELRVARRADELARGNESSRGHDLQIWFQAEREIIHPSAPAGAGTATAA